MFMGCDTFMVKAAAIMASVALPPFCKISIAASVDPRVGVATEKAEARVGNKESNKKRVRIGGQTICKA
jgi:hypothetical protein